MNQRLRGILTSVGASLTGFMTAHSWYITNKSYNNQLDVERLNKELELLHSQVQKLIKTSITNNEKSSFVEAKSINFTERLKALKDYEESIKQHRELLNNPNLSENVKSEILQKIDYFKELGNVELKNSLDAARELNDKVKLMLSENENIAKIFKTVEDNQPINNASGPSHGNTTSTSKTVEVSQSSNSTSVPSHSQITSNSTNPSDLDLSQVQENNILGPIYDFFEAYQKVLSTMSPEQLGCLSNAIGFLIILGAFTSIVIILFGDYLISKLQLETRYPRLAKLIQIRQKVNKYYIIYNILFIYFIVIAYIFINIFMFFQV